jgi:beta-glucosidase
MNVNEQLLKFPDGFVWGTSTSAYQIEGGWNEDGKGPSIWDTFAHTPGKIERDENADVTVDHYHRWESDLDLMASLGIPAYCFSVAWPRVIPDGKGPVNPAGLDFYDRLVDGLLARGIDPYLMLYHWDLPQALQDRGGWAMRETAMHFADYAGVLARRLGDRVKHWITHDEPFVAAMIGHFYGVHAPGTQNPLVALQAVHHMLLSHGCAVQALRSILPAQAQTGIILSVYPIHPATGSDADRQAAVISDGITNRMFMDPLFRAAYPQDVLQLLGPFFPEIQAGDMETIATPIDFLGVNYYTRVVVRADADIPVLGASPTQVVGNEFSQMWEIYPEGMYEVLQRIYRDYHPRHIYITENGVPVPDGMDLDGRVRDERRTRYLSDHLAQAHRAIQDGIPVRGYFHWSFQDNFEWSFGYRLHFGLVYVDYPNQQRTVKDSGRWYAGVIRQNGLYRPNGSHA